MLNRTIALVVGFAAISLASQIAWAQRDAASKIDAHAYEAPYFYDTAAFTRATLTPTPRF